MVLNNIMLKWHNLNNSKQYLDIILFIIVTASKIEDINFLIYKKIGLLYGQGP